MLKIIKTRHSYPESKGFYMKRPLGCDEYVFLMFHTSVGIVLDGKTIRTKPYAMIIYDKPTPQYFFAESDLVHDWIHIDGELCALMQECGLEFDKIYYPLNPTSITETVYALETEFQAAKRYSREISDSLLRTMLYRVSRSLLDGERDINENSDTIRRIRDFRTEMFSHPERQWNVAQMACSSAISESRFYALYKDIFGISPTKDLIGARIERARFYLSTGKYSVSEVAALVGYSNVFHFIRQYKAETGVTPGKASKLSERV